MFTGLVEDVGTIAWVEPRGNGRVLGIRTAIPLAEVKVGDSIATDGVCLTAEGFQGDVFTAVAGRETLERSTLAAARAGRRVHLERALAVGDRLGGHLVQGHVDGQGEVVRSTDARESWILWVRIPRDIARYVAAKGSLCIDGVSLTVNELAGDEVRLNIVPHTARVTRLGGLRPGDRVNLEVDILAKYVERLLGGAASTGGGLTPELLRRYGFEV
jgi:riboflavin synthase